MTSRPNVLLIGLDTLRADHLGCYGYGLRTSPHLDEWAAGAVLFEDAISTHIPTHPGFTTVFTGKDVMEHGVVNISSSMRLAPEVRMLQEILAEQGYRTAAADNMGRWFPRGFATYRDYAFGGSPTAPWRKAETVNGVALPLLDELAVSRDDAPFYLFIHYWDPHTPYLPPPPFDRMYYGAGRDERDPSNHGMDPVWAFAPFADYFRSWMGGVTDPAFPIAQYDAEIAYMDVCLRGLFTRLTELGLDESTLVVIFADHGESLMIHDCYFDHHGLYEDNVHVPLIMKLPGRLPAGRRVPGLVALHDVAPTVLELIGLPELAEREGMTGKSLLPWIEGKATTLPYDWLPVTECTWMRKRGLRTPEWKLIVALEPDFHNKPPVELYNLRGDPEEVTNLAESHPDVVGALRRQLDEWVARRVAETGKPDPLEVTPVAHRRIGALAAGPVGIPQPDPVPGQASAVPAQGPLPQRDPGHGEPRREA